MGANSRALHLYDQTGVRGVERVAYNPADVQIYLGSINFTGGEQIGITRVVRQRYNPITNDNDIALLELDREPADKDNLSHFTYLPGDDRPVNPGQIATVLGWGQLSKASYRWHSVKPHKSCSILMVFASSLSATVTSSILTRRATQSAARSATAVPAMLTLSAWPRNAIQPG